MKKIIIIISLIAVSFSCKAQDNTIHSSELTINGIHFFGNNVTLVTQNFGQPNTIQDYYYEMQDVMSQKYIYNGIIFTIINNKVYSYEITGNNYVFTNHNIKVGDSIETLSLIYPLSYANRSDKGLALTFDDMDRFVIIVFNSTSNLITKIALYSY